jgi:hypothetical protein
MYKQEGAQAKHEGKAASLNEQEYIRPNTRWHNMMKASVHFEYYARNCKPLRDTFLFRNYR